MFIASYRTVVLLAAIVVLPTLSAHADDNTAVRAALIANYARFTQAFQKRDTDAMAKMMTADYLAVAPDKTTSTRAQVLADLKGQMAMLHDVTWKRTITKLTVKGKTAEAVVLGQLVGKTSGKDGKTRVMELKATTEDTWVQAADGTWKIQHSHVLEMIPMIDGQMIRVQH